MVKRGLLVRFENIEDLCLFPAGRFALRPRDDSRRSGGEFAEGNFRGWRGRMGHVRVVVAAAVLTVAVFPLPSYGMSS
jgi:hypothetical protein